MASKILIGTSGWSYKHWKNIFYPSGLKSESEFDFYQQHFSTVEINNSFYRLPTIKTFREWEKQSSAKFIFAVKGSRFITHMKKLNLEKSEMAIFFGRVKYLGAKAGPILFQLPPKWKVNRERLEAFLSRVPKEYRYALEFRNDTWNIGEIFDLLAKYNVAYCIYELAGYQSPLEVTANFVYVRLHGPEGKYQGDYKKSVLRKWAKQCLEWKKRKLDVYFYFDNDQSGYAVKNALELKQLIGLK